MEKSMKKTGIVRIILLTIIILFQVLPSPCQDREREFNGWYYGRMLDRISFPVGGLGAGMFCMDGNGSVSHLSVRHHPDLFNEPVCFAAISVKDCENGAKVLEYQVPEWKYYGRPGAGLGFPGKLYGLPRFEKGRFLARFPFAILELEDEDIPLSVELKGWSPFIPGDEDNSSLPAGVFEYSFRNNTDRTLEAVFSWNSRNILTEWAGPVRGIKGGFVMSENSSDENTVRNTGFAVFTDDPSAIVDHCWFRGQWFDPYIILWKNIETQTIPSNPESREPVGGASIYIPFMLDPGEEKTVKLNFCWYLPESGLSIGNIPEQTRNCRPMKSGTVQNSDRWER